MAKNISRSFSIRHSFCYAAEGGRVKRKVHWADEARLQSNVQKALKHFDDLYGSVFAEKWPSLRIALLTPPKYIAIPNGFTGDVDKICQKLEGLGALPIHPVWTTHKEKLAKQRKEYNLARDLKRISDMERTMESIASTKQAEEMDVLYKNSPAQKIPSYFGSGDRSSRRVLSTVDDAIAEHVAATQLKGMEDFDLDSDYYAVFNKNLSPEANDPKNPFLYTNPSNFTHLEFPPFLRPYCFEPGNPSNFPAAARNVSSGLREYICVNGASITPIIALDLKPGLKILDLCAAPGTKTLMSILTMTPATFTCNDIESSRLKRINFVIAEFLGKENENTIDINFTKLNGTDYPPEPIYDRVLADVPCLSDRVSCTIADNNIFKPKRTKERLNLVRTQQRILKSAFKSLSSKPGSSCVYSTCSLSPVENDGAVMGALRETEVPNLAVDLMGLWNVLAPLQSSGLFYMSRTKFGYLIEPNLMSNFGPMYVSRIVVLPSPSELESTKTPTPDSVPNNE